MAVLTQTEINALPNGTDVWRVSKFEVHRFVKGPEKKVGKIYARHNYYRTKEEALEVIRFKKVLETLSGKEIVP